MKKYEEKFEKYLNGTLDAEESKEIEKDIEKFQVLMGYADQTLDEKLYEQEGEGAEEEPGDSGKEEELGRKISKAIGRKFRIYMIGAVAAAICIVPAFLLGLSPLMDWIYYSPEQSVEIVDEENDSATVVNPFALDMSVYMELFCGDKGFVNLCLWPEGYGRYTIDVRTQIDGEETSHMLELVRNHLYRNDLNWNVSDFPVNAFTYKSNGESCSMGKEEAAKTLEKAPELMKIRAAVSFDGLKSMEELAGFMERYSACYLYCPVDVEGYRYWGFTPVKRGYDFQMAYDEEEYPYLDLAQYNQGYPLMESQDTGSQEEDRGFPEGDGAVQGRLALAAVYEKHVESMIRYLMEREDFLEIFEGGLPGGKNFLNIYEYKEALGYIREHGVKSYGAIVYATKEELLKMLEDPSVEGLYMLDGKIDLKFGE